jgi:YVTN family beta-propeller protein
VIQTSNNTEIARVNVGYAPFCIAVTPNQSKCYIANTVNVCVLNTSTNQVEQYIDVGSAPNFVGMSAAQNLAYVTNPGSDSISIIDTTTNTELDEVSVGGAPIALIVE